MGDDYVIPYITHSADFPLESATTKSVFRHKASGRAQQEALVHSKKDAASSAALAMYSTMEIQQ